MAKKKSIGEMISTLYAFFVFVKVLPMLYENLFLGLLIMFAALVLPLTIYIIYRRLRKKSFFESKNSLEAIKDLTPAQFEEFICHLFTKLGYAAEVVGGPGDGGIDVIATKNGVKHYIQCKKFITQQVTVGAMRDFYGAVTDKLTNAKAFFITTNIFTLEAENFAAGKPIELIDGKRLMEYVRMTGMDSVISERPVFGSSVIEKCPTCGGQLILKTAHKGAYAGKNFYGCSNYPRCRYIKNIE